MRRSKTSGSTKRFKLAPIRNDAEHEAMVARIGRLWDARPGSVEHDQLEILGMLVDAYEARRWPIEAPDPVEAIKARMEQTGRRPRDLAKVLGSTSRASEVLKRRRRLTVEMIWALNRDWQIPAESLIRPYRIEASDRRGVRRPPRPAGGRLRNTG